MWTTKSGEEIPQPSYLWTNPDDNSQEFPKYNDGFPEDLIYNEADKKYLDSIHPEKAQQIINERISARNKIYQSYLQQKSIWCQKKILIKLHTEKTEIKQQRSNLRVIVIIGSNLTIEDKGKGEILLGGEDLADALFIKQVFTFCYGLRS